MRSRAGTIATGALEIGLGVFLWLWWYEGYRDAFYAASAAAGFAATAARPEFETWNTWRYFGNDVVMYAGFFFTLRGLLASFLVAEGMVRALHAFVHEDGCGFLLPWLVRRIRRRLGAPRAVADRGTRYDDGTVAVLGNHHDWDELTTFSLEGRLYTLAARVETGELVRYTLHPAPENHLVRHVVPLDP